LTALSIKKLAWHCQGLHHAMQQLIGALLCLWTLAPAGALKSKIIGFDGKEHAYSWAKNRGHQHKVYDPVLHKVRLVGPRVDYSHVSPTHHAQAQVDTRRNVKLNVAKLRADFAAFKERLAKPKAKTEEKAKDDKAKKAGDAKKDDKAKKADTAKKVEKPAAKKTKKEAKKPKAEKKSKKAAMAKKKPKVNPRSIAAMKKMDEKAGAPTQGFRGPIVQHEDQKTATEDWMTEYGPASKGHHSHGEICKLYPSNSWCRAYLRNLKKQQLAASEPTWFQWIFGRRL